MLETSGSVAKASKKSNSEMTLVSVVLGKPAAPLPMPKDLLLDPLVKTPAANAITLARMPDTPNPTMATTRTCTELLGEALAMLDRLSAADRRPSHSLDRVYVAAALARVRALDP